MSAPSPPSPTGPVHVDTVAIIVPPAVFYGLALTVFSMRMQARWKATGLQLDDAFLALSMLLATAMLVFCALSVHYGLGRPIMTLMIPQRSMSARMLTARAEAWSWGTTLLKLSITTMIVRIKGDKNKWRWPLYAFSAFLIAMAVTSSAWNYTTCIPLEAAWNFSYPRTVCRPQKTNVLYLLIGGIIYTITDLIFAILPLLFILKINRPLREKIVLCFLMGLGILCAAASIPKFISYSVFASGGDTTKNATGVVVWSQIELYVGIIAACIPMLRAFFEGVLRKVGISITNSSRGPSRDRTSGWNRTPRSRINETYEMNATANKSRREPDSESYQGLAASTWEDKKTVSWEEKDLGNNILVTTDFRTSSGPQSFYKEGSDRSVRS